MKRIALTPEIDNWAHQFQADMLYKTPHIESSIACKNLKELISEISKGWLVPLDITDKNGNLQYAQRNPTELTAYIKKIKDEYKTLLAIHPSNFIGKIRELRDLSIQMRYV